MSKGDQWKPNDLIACAKKRISVVPDLKLKDRTAAVYIAGVACEAMFRALRYSNQVDHNSRHSIVSLAKECGYLEKIPFSEKLEVNKKLKVLDDFWWNELRYANENHQIRKYLNKQVFKKKHSYSDFEQDLENVYQKVYEAVVFLMEKGRAYADI